MLSKFKVGKSVLAVFGKSLIAFELEHLNGGI